MSVHVIDPVCACRTEDPFGVIRALQGTPWTAEEWCWGHTLGRPGLAHAPYMRLDGPWEETIRLGAALHRIERNSYGWRLTPVIEEGAVRWTLSPARLALLPVWRPATLAREWHSIGHWIRTHWMAHGSAERHDVPESPDRERQGAAPNQPVQATAATRTVPLEHEDSILARNAERIKREYERWRQIPGVPIMWRWELARLLAYVANWVGRGWAAGGLPTHPWWRVPLDPPIRPLIAALHAAGCRPFSSCAGHPWRGALPYVAFESSPAFVCRLHQAIDAALREWPPLLALPWRLEGIIRDDGYLTWYLESPAFRWRGGWRRRVLEADWMTLAMLVMRLKLS